MNKTTLATILGAAALGIAKKGIDGSTAKVKANVDLFKYTVFDENNTQHMVQVILFLGTSTVDIVSMNNGVLAVDLSLQSQN